MTQQLDNIMFRIKRARDELTSSRRDSPESGWRVLVFFDLQIGADGIPRFARIADENGDVRAYRDLAAGCAAGLHAPVACDQTSMPTDLGEQERPPSSAGKSLYAVPILDREFYDPSPVMRPVLGVASFECPFSIETLIQDRRLQAFAASYAEIFSDVIRGENHFPPQDGPDLNWPTRQIIDRCNELLDDPPRSLIAEIIGKFLHESVSRAPFGTPLNTVKSQLRADLGRRFGEPIARELQPALDFWFLSATPQRSMLGSLVSAAIYGMDSLNLNALKSAVESGVAGQAMVQSLSKEQLANLTDVLLRQVPERFLPALLRDGRVIIDSQRSTWREFRPGCLAKETDLSEYIRIMRLREASASYLATMRLSVR
jgi:hypothetical protein